MDAATELYLARLQVQEYENELAIERARRRENDDISLELTIQFELEGLQERITILETLVENDANEENQGSDDDATGAIVATSTCIICEDDFESRLTASLPCGHSFCRDCLQDFFRRSQADESIFPPKCCEPILLEHVQDFLTTEILEGHEEKKVEFETQDRTYCSDIQCQKFIRPENISGDVGTCSLCKKATCIICKAAAHQQNDCPQDLGTQQALTYGRERGWGRCYTCRALVELVYGCNHINCRCGAEFCYRCGLVWKTCQCPFVSDPRQLMIGGGEARRLRAILRPIRVRPRAALIVQRQVVAPLAVPVAVPVAVPNPVPRPAPLPEAQDLQLLPQTEPAVHDVAQAPVVEASGPQGNRPCTHLGADWDFLRISGSCSYCRQHMPIFLRTCSLCGESRCSRCTRHVFQDNGGVW